MAANKPQKPQSNQGPSASSLALSMGFSIVIPLLVFILGGVAIDNWLHTAPIFILVGVALALFVSGYQLWRLLKAGESE